jgi:hypothetical protein
MSPKATLRLGAVFALLPGGSLAAPRPNVDLVIRNVRPVDVVRETTRPASMIVVAGIRIVYAGKARSGFRGRREVDGRGSYVLPGLWDMHVHALWSRGLWPAARDAFLAHCITGVRDMGGTLDELARARRNPKPAPEIVAAGLILDGPKPVDPSISIAVSNAMEAEQAVKRVFEGGADFVKVYTLLPPAAFVGVVRSARERHLDVVGHIPYGVDALTAATQMRSIEHMRAETGLYCDPARLDSCLPLLAAFKVHRSWQTPTLAVRAVRAHFGPITQDQMSRWTRQFPDRAKSIWSDEFARWSREQPDATARRRTDFDRERKLAQLLIERQVPLLAGSDSGTPMVPFGEGLERELQLLAGVGASPGKALRSAIVEPARFLRRTPVSAVAAGSAANFCLVKANPLRDLASATRPWLTVARGRIGFERAADAVNDGD